MKKIMSKTTDKTDCANLWVYQNKTKQYI
jgi:hypothetical protein